MIDQRFHKTIIGSQGSKIREISTKYPEVNIAFPEAAKQSDIVVLRGPRNDVDQCYKYLQLHVQELVRGSCVSLTSFIPFDLFHLILSSTFL